MRSESESTRAIARRSDISSRVNSLVRLARDEQHAGRVERGGEELAGADVRHLERAAVRGHRGERGVRDVVAREAVDASATSPLDDRAGVGAERLGGALDGGLAGDGDVLGRETAARNSVSSAVDQLAESMGGW